MLYDRPANLFVAGFVGTPSMNTMEARLTVDGNRIAVDVGGVILDVGGYAFAEKPDNGAGVVLGFRPEDVTIAGVEAPGTVPGSLISIEPLGAETLAWISSGASRHCVRLAPDAGRALPVRVGLKIAMNKISLFDPASGRRL
jgi:multiple sugar transport system ATP-binding protein